MLYYNALIPDEGAGLESGDDQCYDSLEELEAGARGSQRRRLPVPPVLMTQSDYSGGCHNHQVCRDHGVWGKYAEFKVGKQTIKSFLKLALFSLVSLGTYFWPRP